MHLSTRFNISSSLHKFQHQTLIYPYSQQVPHADPTVYTFRDEICTPPAWVGIDNVKLSWGMMQLTTGNTSSFTISRSLRVGERLDWSTFAADPAGIDEARLEHVLPGCEHYRRSTDVDPVGKVLQPKSCIHLGMMANVSFPFRERAKFTHQYLALVRECVSGLKVILHTSIKPEANEKFSSSDGEKDGDAGSGRIWGFCVIS